MYEFAEEVDSISSAQNIVGQIFEKKPFSNSEFPYEVELRFQTDTENDHPRIVRHTEPMKRRFDGNTTNDRRNSLQQLRNENENTKSNTTSKNRLATCRRLPFLKQILCVDCF